MPAARVYRWYSIDPRVGHEIDYPDDMQDVLEAYFQTPDYAGGTVELVIGGKCFTVDLRRMKQTNDRNGSRHVCREPADEVPKWKKVSSFASPARPTGSTASASSAAAAGGRGSKPRASTSSSTSVGGADTATRAYSSHAAAAPATRCRPSEPEPKWVSIEPRTNSAVPYEVSVQRVLEAAYQTPNYGPDIAVVLGGAEFTLSVGQMKQWNKRKPLRRRDIKRIPPQLPRWLDGDHATPAAVAAVDRDLAARCLESVATVENFVKTTFADGTALGTATPTTAPDSLWRPVVDVYDAVLAALNSAEYRTKYDCTDPVEDASLLRLPLGEAVPNYYANREQGSMYKRKILSALGLRNLVVKGFAIYEQMRQTHFSGRTSDYREGEGPSAMRYFTGNAVDLDTTVLRCTDPDVRRYVNAANAVAGLPEFKTVQDFSDSQQAKCLALTQARLLIDRFIADTGLADDCATLRARRIELPEESTWPTYRVHTSMSNSDRGQHAIWQYRAAGQATFHANVPDMADVRGALLQAPWQAAKAFCKIQLLDTADARKKWLDAFFEDCISDSCFNGKWKAVEAFNEAFEYEMRCAERPTVRRQLELLQMQNQVRFVNADTDDEELQVTMALIQEKGLKGWTAAGAEVAITRRMVEQWMASPGMDF